MCLTRRVCWNGILFKFKYIEIVSKWFAVVIKKKDILIAPQSHYLSQIALLRVN